MTGKISPMWACEKCGRTFANRNQTHACGQWTLDRHFIGTTPNVRAIYDAFLAMLERFGDVTVIPEKTRIAFHIRMSFAQITPRRNWVNGHLVLARRIEDPLFIRIETISPRNHVHHFRLDRPEEVARLNDFAREAQSVGRQEHLG